MTSNVLMFQLCECVFVCLCVRVRMCVVCVYRSARCNVDLKIVLNIGVCSKLFQLSYDPMVYSVKELTCYVSNNLRSIASWINKLSPR